MLGLGEVRQDGEQRAHLQPDGQRTGVRTARAAVGELTDLERDPGGRVGVVDRPGAERGLQRDGEDERDPVGQGRSGQQRCGHRAESARRG